MSRNINEIVKDVHETAVEKGWWDDGDRNPLELQMLMVSEIAEACEEVRKGTPPIYADPQLDKLLTDVEKIKELNMKPEGELIELADVVIRIMDYCGRKDWDLNEAIEMKIAFNKTRPHRHGGKKF